MPKITALTNCTDISWHFIDRLQSNKICKVVENFAYIHNKLSPNLKT
ncbi:hypothetical protein D082_31970 [Synechocystis sp. PCC 6714]|nr:hypothetical protein D082_31970 [Synechocystis sp. PCC 6714]